MSFIPLCCRCLFCFVFSLIKAGIHLKAVFTPLKIGLILSDVSRSRFKHYKNPMLITQINVLGRFEKFLVKFRSIWEDIVSQKSSKIWRNKK